MRAFTAAAGGGRRLYPGSIAFSGDVEISLHILKFLLSQEGPAYYF
jgi:hypothetical protein